MQSVCRYDKDIDMNKDEVFALIEKYYDFLKTDYGFAKSVLDDSVSFSKNKTAFVFYYDDYEHDLIAEYNHKNNDFNLFAVLHILDYCQKQRYSINCWDSDFATNTMQEYASFLKVAVPALVGNDAKATVAKLKCAFEKEPTYYEAYLQSEQNLLIREAIASKNYRLAYTLLNEKTSLSPADLDKKHLLEKLIGNNKA